ncbi:sugar isomerase domain-containing protein [Catelliglobosispora koreensis]|uniref:sugar isomerase domain-containing protein n=1 Tax=Catelliglobosispora koreensis TaxID=129052 RepID=UPI00036A16FD|nr:SIS domain-containing protein [Catelliglobosispora koreensis]
MTYLEQITELVRKVGESQAGNIDRAATLITECLTNGGVVQAFGSGHSEALAMEIAGRAGGLIATNRIALRDLVFYGGESFSTLEDPLLERREGVAAKLYELAPISKDDVFVIASNSGINGVIVELALHVKERGHGLIAVTSLEHSQQSVPRHASGKRLSEIADVVLDNGAPFGDVILPNRTGAVSSVTAAVLAQLVVTEVATKLEAAGQTPPIYLSANIPGGHEHNLELEARYAGRIRRTA